MQKNRGVHPEKTGEADMDAALKKCDRGWKNVENQSDLPRTDATFTEIYELIFYNQTMVRSELAVLLQLIQRKLMEKIGATSACTDGDVCGDHGVQWLCTQKNPCR